jgi:hypothetical protein
MIIRPIVFIFLFFKIVISFSQPLIDPSASGNLVLWLDAETIGLNNGDKINQWVDQSTIGYIV